LAVSIRRQPHLELDFRVGRCLTTPPTRQKAGSFAASGNAVGGVKAPAPTGCATVIVVLGAARDVRLSHVREVAAVGTSTLTAAPPLAMTIVTTTAISSVRACLRINRPPCTHIDE